jgi:hypothetical protein
MVTNSFQDLCIVIDAKEISWLVGVCAVQLRTER